MRSKEKQVCKKWTADLDKRVRREEIQMVKKHMKKSPWRSVTQKMQINTAMRTHHTSTRQAEIKIGWHQMW